MWKEIIQELETFETEDMKKLLLCKTPHDIEVYFENKGVDYKNALQDKFRTFYTQRVLLNDYDNLKMYREKAPPEDKEIMDELFKFKTDDESFKNFKMFLNRFDDDEDLSSSKKFKHFKQMLVERAVLKDIRKLGILLQIDYDDKYIDYKLILKKLEATKIEIEKLKERLAPFNWDSKNIVKEFHESSKTVMVSAKKACFGNLADMYVKAILHHELTLNNSVTTPLAFLCQYGTIEMFKALMDAGNGCRVIWPLIENDEWVKPALRSNKSSPTLLHFAAMNPTDEILSCLYDKKLVTSKDFSKASEETGNTPLHFAAHAGRTKCVDFFLQHGADYTAKNLKEETALHFAANSGDLRTLNHIYKMYPEEENCLLEDAQYGTPLLYAAKNWKFDCIGSILNKQELADATIHDEDCDTALHYISKDANARWLAKVLKANALLGVKNEVGNSPIDWISKEKLQELLDNHTHLVKLKCTGDTSRKDHVEVIFTNLFGHHASGSDMKNIMAIAQTPTVEDLSLHPLCQAIVSVKWQKIRKFFLLKLIFFVLFVFFMSLHPILIMQKQKFENEQDNSNSSSKEIPDTMSSWIKLSYNSFTFLLAIQIFFGLISVFVMIPPFFRESRVYVNSKKFNMRRVRRLMEYYVQELLWSDWYEYMLWIIAILYMLGSVSPILVVVTSWFSLFYVCSNHPSILPFRYMLVKILFRYLKFLLFSFGLIGGFALGFFLLTNKCILDGKACVQAGSGFENLYTTALKVPSMMMGEISFDSFQFEARPYLQFLFGSFIFLMTCCLFNMMNGLAINITSELEKKSKIFSTIAQCEMIFEFEVLLKEVHGWLKWLCIPGELRILNALWVERIKVKPSSGACQNLEKYNKNIHGSVGDGKLTLEDLWETNKNTKVDWVWVDRGYSLNSKIIRRALARCEESKNVYKDPADVEVDFNLVELNLAREEDDNLDRNAPAAGAEVRKFSQVLTTHPTFNFGPNPDDISSKEEKVDDEEEIKDTTALLGVKESNDNELTSVVTRK